MTIEWMNRRPGRRRRSLAMGTVVALVLAASPAFGLETGTNSQPGLSRSSPGQGETFRIAWTDPDAAVAEAADHRVFILHADAYDRVPLIKAANPDAVVLVYKNLAATVSQRWAYDAGTQTDAEFLTTGVGYGDANQNHPEWFLTGPDGRRLEFAAWPKMWHMDIGNPEYQAAWLANVKADVETYGWDGVFMDDAIWQADANNDPGPTRYPTDSAMRAATRSMLQAVSPPLRDGGHLTFANIGAGNGAPDLWADWLTLLDGAMEEYFTNYGETPGGDYLWDWGLTGWKTHVDNVATAASMGKTALVRIGGADGDRDAFRYGLASFLLVNDGRSVISPPEEQGPPDYPELTWDLGEPTDPYRVVGNSVYRRDFSAGTAIVNAGQQEATVPLGATYLDHEGHEITSVTLPATRGAILRAAGALPPPTTVPPPTGSYRDTVLGDDPVAYWRLGEGPGSPTAADASGNSHPGSYQGGVTTGAPGAVAGDTAAGFDGQNDKVVVNDHSSLRLNGAFSIEFWAKRNASPTTWPGILNKNGSWGPNGYLIWYGSDGRMYLKRNNTQWEAPAGSLTSDRLRHFVVTYDGFDVRWYVDGAMASHTPASFPPNEGSAPLDLGHGDLGHPGAVVLDEVALYPVALTSAQVGTHHQAAELPPAPPPTTVPPPTGSYRDTVLGDDPVAYWRLGEGPGSPTAADASGNGRPGSYQGGVTSGLPGAVAGDTAASFDGQNDKVVVNDHTSLRLNGPFSIEFWAKRNASPTTWPGILNKNGSWGPNGYLIWYGSDGRMYLKRNNTQWEAPAGSLTSDRLRHFVVTYDGFDVRWYVDGAMASQAPASLPPNEGSAPLDLGHGDLGHPGAVVLDEVALYPVALTSAQVGTHHQAAAG